MNKNENYQTKMSGKDFQCAEFSIHWILQFYFNNSKVLFDEIHIFHLIVNLSIKGKKFLMFQKLFVIEIKNWNLSFWFQSSNLWCTFTCFIIFSVIFALIYLRKKKMRWTKFKNVSRKYFQALYRNIWGSNSLVDDNNYRK